MLRILIVEDDFQLAVTLKYLVEDNPRYHVIATAEDAETAIAAAEEHDPDLVLLDLHLANATTGFSVAVRLNGFASHWLELPAEAADPTINRLSNSSSMPKQ